MSDDHGRWLVLHCPHCGEEMRKRVNCVDAIKRAEDAERRSTLAAVAIAELRAEVDRLKGASPDMLPAVIEGRAA